MSQLLPHHKPRIVSGSDYLSLPASPETWLLEPLLPSGGALLLYGEPKIGKSFAALQLADAIGRGTSWLGFPARRGHVVYAQLDTPRNVWQARLRQLITKGAMSHPPACTDRELLETWPFDVLNPEHLIMLREELQARSPDLVIIDTLREAHSADENDSTEMQKAIAALVAATEPAALCVVSHARKPSREEGFSLMNDNRGSSYVVGRMDAIVRFTPKTARVSGRSIEEHSLDLEREDSGFWNVKASEVDHYMLSILLDPAVRSVREAGKLIGAHLKRSESAGRALVRRFLAAHPEVQSTLRS